MGSLKYCNAKCMSQERRSLFLIRKFLSVLSRSNAFSSGHFILMIISLTNGKKVECLQVLDTVLIKLVVPSSSCFWNQNYFLLFLVVVVVVLKCPKKGIPHGLKNLPSPFYHFTRERKEIVKPAPPKSLQFGKTITSTHPGLPSNSQTQHYS